MREDLSIVGNELNYITATFWASYCTFMIPACYFMTHSLSGQHRPPGVGSRLGSLDIWPSLGSERGDRVCHAFSDWHVRVLLFHRHNLCHWPVVQAERDRQTSVAILHCESAWNDVCGISVCQLNRDICVID